MLKLKMLVYAVLCCLTGFTHAADMVVIHSDSVALKVGRMLDSQQSLSLMPGEQVTVIFGSGAVQTVRGPFNGTLDDPGSGQTNNMLVSEISRFLQQPGSATRSRRTEGPDDIWAIDLSTNKRHYCVDQQSSITLWRPDSQTHSASKLIIKHKPTNHQANLMWPANRPTLGWPASQLPVRYGDTYTVEFRTLRGQSHFKKLVLYQLPGNLPTDSHKVVWMIGRGCIPQANMLLSSLR